MDTSRWSVGDEFTVLGLKAALEFKTAASLSFKLQASSDTDSLPEAANLPPLLLEMGPVQIVLGWLDVHHPCEGAHRLLVRAGLPDRYVSWESMRDLVKGVLTELNLPVDESYRIEMVGVSQQMTLWHPQLEFESTSKWRAPGE